MVRTGHSVATLKLFLLSCALIALSSCGKEELTGPCGTDQETNGDAKVLITGTVDDMDQGRSLEGSTLRGMELDGDGLPDDGISDDGNDEGDSERNRKVKN
jgi:hypothetical protein